jgi:hypothetical protein
MENGEWRIKRNAEKQGFLARPAVISGEIYAEFEYGFEKTKPISLEPK